jgi:hypothetical protein
VARFDSVRGLVCVVSATLVGSVLNATAQDNGSGAYLSLIQQLTRAAYIDLVDESTEVLINFSTLLSRDWSPDGTVHLLVRKFVLSTQSEPRQPNTPLVEAVFQAANGRFDSVLFKGPLARSTATERLTEQALAHVSWMDEDMNAALKRAGARFGMDQKDEFIRAAGVERIGSVFGSVRSMNTRFVWRKPNVPRKDVLVNPMWAVNLEIDAAQGERQCFSLGFDPFTLRLNNVYAFACK